MCEIRALETQESEHYIPIKYETIINCSKETIIGNIEGKIMKVSKHKEFYPDFLDKCDDNDNILFIDHFYPLGRRPAKNCLGEKFGEKCLSSFLDQMQKYKIIIVRSVYDDNKYMHNLLINKKFEIIKKNGARDYGWRLIFYFKNSQISTSKALAIL